MLARGALPQSEGTEATCGPRRPKRFVMVAHGHGDHPAATPSVLNLQRRSLRKLTARRALPAKYASPFVSPGAMGMAFEGGEVNAGNVKTTFALLRRAGRVEARSMTFPVTDLPLEIQEHVASFFAQSGACFHFSRNARCGATRRWRYINL